MQKKIRQNQGPVDNSKSLISELKTVPYDSVKITNGFWKKRQTLNRKVSLKHGYDQLEKAGNFFNLRMAADRKTGEFRGIIFYDEDVFKWLEALAWEIGVEPDPELQQMAETVINLITAAQLPDGYLNSYYQVAEPGRRWTDLDFGHELYCAGHLFQAGVALQRATGDDRLLGVACRFAEHIDSVFGPGKKEGAPGHPEVEMALVELYRATQEEKYLKLAQFFIDQRGKGQMRGMGSNGPEYHQDHMPVREAAEAVGHAVRQMYLLSGLADTYMETGEGALWDVSERLWADITGSKMYITGGVGSRYDGESFGESYEMPPDQCYCETCAAIGSLMWNWRLLLLTGDGRYADEMERTLYNGILSSPALDGKHYFYVNPLMVRSGGSMRLSSNRPEEVLFDGRPEWHEVACCPTNVMRLLSSLAHYFVTTDSKGIQVHQYATSDSALCFDDHKPMKLHIDTNYPWDGHVKVNIDQDRESSWALRLRIPGWCKNFVVLVNGKEIDGPMMKQGYLVIDRLWSPGDIVKLCFSMPPKLVYPHPRIDAVRGCAALQRGPLVYCLEEHDQEEQASLLDVIVDQEAQMQINWREDLLGGIYTIKTIGTISNTEIWNNHLYSARTRLPSLTHQKIPLVAIPYYAWGNRGLREMRVWLPVQEIYPSS